VEPPLISHTNAIDAIWLETLAAPTVAQSFKTNAPAVSRANHHKLLFWRRGWDSNPRSGLLPTPVFKSYIAHFEPGTVAYLRLSD